MLSAHRFAEFLALPPQVRDAAVRDFVDDYLAVAVHVLGDESPDGKTTRLTYNYAPTLNALMDALRAHEVPHALDRVVGFVLFELRWRARYRPLTEAESAIHDAACRLSDAWRADGGC